MPKSARPRPGEKARSLTVVRGDPDPDAAELAHLRELAASSGAPAEVLRLLDAAGDVDEAMEALGQAGLLPQDASGLFEIWLPLLDPGCDSLTAELSGAEFLAMVRAAAGDNAAMPDLLAAMIGEAVAYAKPEALAMLRVLAVVGPAESRPAAAQGAAALVAAGLKDRPWARQLGSPRVGPCFGYSDELGAQESITVTFSYGRKSHAVVVLIDYDLGGGVKDCFLSDRPGTIRSQYQQSCRGFGLEFTDYEPAEAGAILRTALSRPPCPVEPDQVQDVGSYLELLRTRAELLPAADGGIPPVPAQAPGPARTARGARSGRSAGGRTAGSAGGPAVHRVKITLRGARPPIWRRLEVPSGISLQRLHRVIQAAFGWADYHLWVFDTPAGEYGNSGRELGHRGARSAKLSDVAAFPGDRIRYTYDFGDDWEHELVVEDVLPAEPGVAYPRCTAGRRACPPEDCGGMWGYQYLLEILADPGHSEHADRLEWLGLDAPGQFDPAEFDISESSQALAGLARVLKR